jgi:hypothetical protein
MSGMGQFRALFPRGVRADRRVRSGGHRCGLRILKCVRERAKSCTNNPSGPLTKGSTCQVRPRTDSAPTNGAFPGAPGAMTNLSCAERPCETCDSCRAVAVFCSCGHKPIYSATQLPVTNGCAAVRLHADQIDVSPRDQFAVIAPRHALRRRIALSMCSLSRQMENKES